MPRPFLCLVAILPLTACNSGPSAEPATVVAPDNGYTARMAALNEGERNGVLFRAIRDAGRACQGVVRSQAVDPVQGKKAWLAACDDDGQWLVVMGDDGIAAVTDARALVGAQKAGG